MSATEATTGRTARAESNKNAVDAYDSTLHNVSSQVVAGQALALLCECANANCDQAIGVSAHEYEAVHRNGDARFLVFPDDLHYSPAIEQVLVHGNRYWIVETTETRVADPTRRHREPPLSIRT